MGFNRGDLPKVTKKINTKSSEITQCCVYISCYSYDSYSLGSFQEMGEGFKLDCQGRLNECALLKSTKLQETLTSETLWIYRLMMMIFQLMAEKYLEKWAFCFCTKAKFCLLHSTTVPPHVSYLHECLTGL